MGQIHATTIFAVHHNGSCAMAGDGQVTLGNAVVMKHTARKVRRLFNGQVLAGFAGVTGVTVSCAGVTGAPHLAQNFPSACS